MSEKLDRFVPDLLEKTRANKLHWEEHSNPVGGEEYLLPDVGDGYSFRIWRRISGENRKITLRLQHSGRPTLDETVNNWPPLTGPDMVSRFRLYSDLFDAVRENVYGKDETLEKVEQLLRKIG